MRAAMRVNLALNLCCSLASAGAAPGPPPAVGLCNLFCQHRQPQQVAAVAQIMRGGVWRQEIPVLLLGSRTALDVVPFPKNRPEVGVGRSRVGALVVCSS